MKITCSLLLCLLLTIGCTHKAFKLYYYQAQIDTIALHNRLFKIKNSFLSENLYHVCSIDSLPNGVFVIHATRKGKTYKILTHKHTDVERFYDSVSEEQIQVGKYYPFSLESWKETCRPKDLSEFCCAINGVEYYGNNLPDYSKGK